MRRFVAVVGIFWVSKNGTRRGDFLFFYFYCYVHIYYMYVYLLLKKTELCLIFESNVAGWCDFKLAGFHSKSKNLIPTQFTSWSNINK